MPRNSMSDFDKQVRHEISTNLKKLLESRGLTQVELSELVNIPASTLSGYFAERSTPTAGNIQKLADFFGVNKSDIDPRYNYILSTGIECEQGGDYMDTRDNISKNLIQLLEENNMTRADLAKILNVSESTVGKWILKKSVPRLSIIEKIADYFKINKSDMLDCIYPTSTTGNNVVNIKDIRKNLGYTMKELSLMVGVSEATISRWESGDIANMKQNNIVALANALNISPLDVLGFDDTTIEKNLIKEDRIKYQYEYDYLPVSVSAGSLENIDSQTKYNKITLPDEILGRYAGSKNIVILKVNGESMNNIIPDGSYIVVDTSKKHAIDIKNRDIVVIAENGSYTVKRYINDKTNKRFIFKPDSSDDTYLPIEISYSKASEIELIGRVIKYIVNLY